MSHSESSGAPLWSRAGWPGIAAALAAGAALPFAFAPFHVFPLAIVAPALLFFLWLDAGPRRAAARGFAFGLGMFGIGVSWIFVSIHEYGYVNLPLSLFLTGLFIAVMASFPALLGYTLARVFARADEGVKLWLAYPAGWALFEWMRGWFLTGFPWLNLGYSQIDAPLAGTAPVAGVYGVSLAAAWSASVLLASLRARTWRARGLGTVCLLALWGGAFALRDVSWTTPAGAPIEVSLLQGNVSQDVKWSAEQRQPTIDLYTRLTYENLGRDLIIWPETALPAFYEYAVDYLDALGEDARARGTDILLGLIYEDTKTLNYYNSMISVGRKQTFYHKHHLVPFTEYLPMKNLLGGLVDFMQVPMSDFSAGDARQPPFEVAGTRVGMNICFEDAFGEEIIRALPEAEVLANVSNDAWFGTTIAPPQHLQIARMRALETGRPLLRTTNTGLTAIIDPNGKIQARAPQFEVAALHGRVQPMGGMTPYARAGNTPVVIVALLMLGAAAWRRGAFSST